MSWRTEVRTQMTNKKSSREANRINKIIMKNNEDLRNEEEKKSK